MKDLIKEIENLKIGKYLVNEPLIKHTTYKVGGLASLIIYPLNVHELIELLRLLKSKNLKYIILGNGSNVLFSDDKFEDIIIKLDYLNNLEFDNDLVIVGGGYNLAKLSSICSNSGLSSLEFACGIPGTVGASVYMNAGAYSSNMQSIVKEIKVITPELEIKTLNNNEIEFDYRTSFLKKNKDFICIEATLKLEKGNTEEIMEKVRERIKKRQESQPLEFPNAGSVFRNPENNAAGKLIEDIGLKGYTIGGAQVSEKHANFIINKNNASASDINKLIMYVKEKVKENYNIDLEVEQEIINF
jgi:UDP-N-acetylmuramate dehydrogenase